MAVAFFTTGFLEVSSFLSKKLYAEFKAQISKRCKKKSKKVLPVDKDKSLRKKNKKGKKG